MIRAVIFDMGGTLEEVYYDDALRLGATPGLRAILTSAHLDLALPDAELCRVVVAGMKKYAKWRVESEKELPPEQVWTEFVFANYDVPQAKLAVVGEELAFYWDSQFSKRTLRPEVPAMLDALNSRGFRLGVISNITSRKLVPYKLDEYNIAQKFQAVLTSVGFGWRKPNAQIFLETARQLGLPASECAYVGDTISRDVVGARRAGYGLAIQIKSFLTTVSDKATDTEPPNAIITNLMQVVDLVAPLAEKTQ